eukprot:TRINITY_DN433_c0_g1_i5.p1 TRINITY_DN433_c0_g1~~TRINITY_DN433_c0_g1_i5.p1  ORF type:complete len:992 (-),score=87.38 TRINITY_DN433_c0_g1_i5:170-3145(-)
MIRRPPRSTLSSSSAASDVYKRQVSTQSTGACFGNGWCVLNLRMGCAGSDERGSRQPTILQHSSSGEDTVPLTSTDRSDSQLFFYPGEVHLAPPLVIFKSNRNLLAPDPITPPAFCDPCDPSDMQLLAQELATSPIHGKSAGAFIPATDAYLSMCTEMQSMWHFKTLREAELLVAHLGGFETPPKTILVIGQSGVGKSSLIKAFVADTLEGEAPEVGHGLDVTTTQLQLYRGRVGAEDILFVDTPGFEDSLKDASIWSVIEQVMNTVPIDAVLVLEKANVNRGSIILRTICAMIAAASSKQVGHSPWDQVILVGTHRDEALGESDFPNEIGVKLKRFEAFKQTMPAYLNKLVIEGQPVAIQEQMVVVTQVGERNGNPEDLRELKRAIAGIQRGQLRFDPLSNHTLSELLRQSYHLEEDQIRLVNDLIRVQYSSPSLRNVRTSVGTKLPTLVAPDVEYKVKLPDAGQLCALLSFLAYLVPREPGSPPEGCQGDDMRRDLLFALKTSFPEQHFVYAQGCMGCMDALVILAITASGTMVVAYRSTLTIADWLSTVLDKPTEFAANCPELQVHTLMNNCVEHVLWNHKTDLLKLIFEYKVHEVVFTGHSLGGGLAQLAAAKFVSVGLGIESCFDSLAEEDMTKIRTLEFHAFTFAAPMVFHYDETKMFTAKQTRLLAALVKFTNYVSAGDMVPRMPGMPEYWVPALQNMLNQEGEGISWFFASTGSASYEESSNRILKQVKLADPQQIAHNYHPVLTQMLLQRKELANGTDEWEDEPVACHNFVHLAYQPQRASNLVVEHSILPFQGLPRCIRHTLDDLTPREGCTPHDELALTPKTAAMHEALDPQTPRAARLQHPRCPLIRLGLVVRHLEAHLASLSRHTRFPVGQGETYKELHQRFRSSYATQMPLHVTTTSEDTWLTFNSRFASILQETDVARVVDVPWLNSQLHKSQSAPCLASSDSASTNENSSMSTSPPLSSETPLPPRRKLSFSQTR